MFLSYNDALINFKIKKEDDYTFSIYQERPSGHNIMFQHVFSKSKLESRFKKEIKGISSVSIVIKSKHRDNTYTYTIKVTFDVGEPIFIKIGSHYNENDTFKRIVVFSNYSNASSLLPTSEEKNIIHRRLYEVAQVVEDYLIIKLRTIQFQQYNPRIFSLVKELGNLSSSSRSLTIGTDLSKSIFVKTYFKDLLQLFTEEEKSIIDHNRGAGDGLSNPSILLKAIYQKYIQGELFYEKRSYFYFPQIIPYSSSRYYDINYDFRYNADLFRRNILNSAGGGGSASS